MQMVIPRSNAHLHSMVDTLNPNFFRTVPGVYGDAAGTFTSCTMNSVAADDACKANWHALDNGAWFIRASAYTEPSGDYNSHCWLGVNGIDNDGFVFNDAYCNYETGPAYACSDNAK
jgi:hypothetical protein